MENELHDNELFGNPEYAAYYNKEAKIFRSYIYKQFGIALDSHDPLVAEYLMLNNFYGKIEDNIAQISEVNIKLDNTLERINANVNSYYEEAISEIKSNQEFSKDQFAKAANLVALELTKKIESLQQQSTKTPKTHFNSKLLATICCLTSINLVCTFINIFI